MELRRSESGKDWARLSVGVVEGDHVTWVSVSVFEEKARALVGLAKGTEVYAEGRLSLNAWTGHDGAERTGLSVTAWRVEVLGQIGGRPGRSKARRERAEAVPFDDALTFCGEGVNILQAIADPNLFAAWFKDHQTWAAWRVFLGALFGLRIENETLYAACTGGRPLPEQQAREACRQAPTRAMSPTVPQGIIDGAFEEDPIAAAAEYGAEFRSDVESYITQEAVDACIVSGRFELPPVAGTQYIAFVDPAAARRIR